MFASFRAASRATAVVQRRGLFGSSGSKDPVTNVFLQELKKLKGAKSAASQMPEAQKLAKEIEALKSMEGLKELGVKIGGK